MIRRIRETSRPRQDGGRRRDGRRQGESEERARHGEGSQAPARHGEGFDPLGRTAAGFGLSAALLTLAFLPQFYGVTVWFALVPALVAARRAPLKRVLWISWAAGYACCLAIFYWIMIVTVSGGLLLPIYLGLYWPLFFLGTEYLNRRLGLPRFAGAIALWPLLEFTRGWALTGLPWFYLGHALYRWPRLIQTADLGGVLFVSAVVMAVNALLVEAYLARRRGAKRAMRTALAAAGALLAANLAYGAWRVATLDERDGPVVAMVQPNVPQSIKIDQTEEEALEIFLDLRRLTVSPETQAAEVVFWPETIMPGYVGADNFLLANAMLSRMMRTGGEELLDELEAQGALDGRQRGEVSRLVAGGTGVVTAFSAVTGRPVEPYLTTEAMMAATSKIAGKPVVTGSIAVEFAEDGSLAKAFNRIHHFDAEGREVERYDKVHLVPFGEFTPFRDAWPALSRLMGRVMPVESLTYAGDDFKVFQIGRYRYGPAICFEDTLSYISRRLRRMDADILLNVTNDGWFGGSFEMEAHLGNAVFRAVETRMAVVRSTNTGISSVISPRGVVTARLVDRDGRQREVQGAMSAPVRVSDARPAYLVAGDRWLILLAAWPALWIIVGRRRAARQAAQGRGFRGICFCLTCLGCTL